MSCDGDWVDYEVELFEKLQDEGKSITEIEEIIEMVREEADWRAEQAWESRLENEEE